VDPAFRISSRSPSRAPGGCHRAGLVVIGR